MVYSQNEHILIFMQQISYKATIQLSYMKVVDVNNWFISIEHMSNTSEILISNCQFQFNRHSLLNNRKGLFTENGFNGIVCLSNCQFFNNTSPDLIKLHGSTVHISQCIFYNSHGLSIYRDGFTMKITRMIITNTSFTYMNSSVEHDVIHLQNTNLTFTGTVTFTNINQIGIIISLEGFSTITITGLVKFTNNSVYYLINFKNYGFMILKEFAAIEISLNEVCAFFKTEALKPIPYPFCFFQYTSNDRLDQQSTKHRNFSVTFYYNIETRYQHCTSNIPIANCKWMVNLELTFNDIVPLDVNKQFIQYYDNNNSSIESLSINQSTLCICSDNMNYDCHISDLGYLYPGQTLFIILHSTAAWHKYHDTEVVVKNDINLPYAKPCTVLDINEYQQSISKHKPCSRIQYTISFLIHKWCKIHLKTSSPWKMNDKINIFTIRKLKCPPGFAETHKNLICQCEPAITSFIMISCNINDQTILRPANSWISATTHNNSYTYQISLHCPFHYCIPHSSHLNFSTPNSQCQFNRSGLLCGQCEQGLSSVFGSPYCQQCSNIYILLIIPITLAGLLLVFLIFYLNLTVTDGNINAFILYTNIISINISVFFPTTNEIMLAYTFISLANLDLGIQTCFYNGMDDYAKMWLQLSFPFYLVIIAALIIILSRHYITIQRLTARRALPVLATLFLLSYTKILQTISSVLFFYTSITYLPSKHTTLVWSVDANVPLFGVKFTILFIVCLMLFLILLSFNIILLFTRRLSWLTFINKFKPLLDAYQGPYKDKYYYWTGLQLLLRAIFFGLSSLNRNINLMVGIILLGMFGGITGVVRPFKNDVKNYQELLLIFNLHGLYAVSLYIQDNANLTVINVMITISAVQFMFIFVYHVITYGCAGVFRNKIELFCKTLTGWIAKSQSKLKHQQFKLQSITRNSIPEVAFNYREYREPLVGYN